jgi:hypothetical protein
MAMISDVEGLRRMLTTTRFGERYDWQVPDDGREIRLRRRT